jgi:hypothetical protein
MRTQWQKLVDPNDRTLWVWVMENPLFEAAKRWAGCHWWTNVLSPDNPDPHTYWTYGTSIGRLTGEIAENVRLITKDEWVSGIHGDEGER